MMNPAQFPKTVSGLFLLLSLGAMGCSSSTPAKEPEKCKLQIISAAIISSPYINPTTEGEPRPVQLRLYQLKTDTSFQNASFERIWKDDKEALGEDLVKVEEFPVYPDSRTELKFERAEPAQFLIAAGLFREPKGRSWFASFELPPPPNAGSCAAKCVSGQCDAGAEANPKFYIWVEDTRVVDGIEHADDYPKGRVHSVEDVKPTALGPACDSLRQALATPSTDELAQLVL
jgi:type VI secretion system protein VasD